MACNVPLNENRKLKTHYILHLRASRGENIRIIRNVFLFRPSSSQCLTAFYLSNKINDNNNDKIKIWPYRFEWFYCDIIVIINNTFCNKLYCYSRPPPTMSDSIPWKRVKEIKTETILNSERLKLKQYTTFVRVKTFIYNLKS